ncbi:MAG: hypothetical protein ACQKBW_04465 [Puniceicoccales bacterium]
MKILSAISTVPLLVFLLFSSALQAELHEFTDTQGRTMKAELINVIGNKVRLKREDGAAFTVSPAIFSQEDQDYIHMWMIHTLNERGSLLHVEARSSQTNSKKHDDGSAKWKTWDGYYKMKIENDSDISLRDVRIEYNFWTFHMDLAAQSRRDGDTEITSGSLTIPMLKSRNDFECDSAKVSMRSFDLRSGWSWLGGGKDESEDKLEGIWIRVYYQGELIEDWSNPSSLKEKYKWVKPK